MPEQQPSELFEAVSHTSSTSSLRCAACSASFTLLSLNNKGLMDTGG